MAAANMPSPACVKDVLGQAPHSGATELLHLSMRPMEHREALLGMAWAFVSLHELMASPEYENILSGESRAALKGIAIRERAGLEICLAEISGDRASFQSFCDGFASAQEKIATCFSVNSVDEPVE
jgi:hypothetical protein